MAKNISYKAVGLVREGCVGECVCVCVCACACKRWGGNVLRYYVTIINLSGDNDDDDDDDHGDGSVF